MDLKSPLELVIFGGFGLAPVAVRAAYSLSIDLGETLSNTTEPSTYHSLLAANSHLVSEQSHVFTPLSKHTSHIKTIITVAG